MERQIDLPVALVLGAAVWADGQASPTLRRRAVHAATLYRDAQVSHIIGCGGVGKHPPSEAAVIRDICVEHGVPVRHISLEDTSTTTLENIENTQPILSRLGADAVVIVTDQYHAPRARLIARHLGLTARTDCPKNAATKNTATKRLRTLKSYARELPALLLYVVRFKRG